MRLTRTSTTRWLNRIVIGAVIALGLGYLAIVVAASPAFSIDGRTYAAATQAWFSGNDPWAVEVQGIRFAAPPSSLLFMLPLAWLPIQVAGTASVVIAGLCAVLAIRMANAPWWWLLSIPVIEGVFVGSADLAAVVFVIWAVQREGTGRHLAGAALAPLAKIYALVPAIALGRRWSVLAGVAALVITAPLLPWQQYFDRSPELIALLVKQAGQGSGSPWSTPWLVPPTIVALVLLGRRDGAWLLVPALWPASQAHYGVFMLPVGSPVLALVAAIPVSAAVAKAVMVLAVVRAVEGKLDPWSWLPNRWRPAGAAPSTTEP